MKWPYCIFLIFATWMYQRIVFYPPTINYRAPSSVQINPSLERKIASNKDFHAFYRAYVPLFYEVIQNDSEMSKIFSPLLKFNAGMAGDSHIENFGFVLNSYGNASLVINDVDDVTKGPIYLDVMRLYISGKIIDENLSWNNYFEAYQKGLKGEEHIFSDFTNKSKENAPSTIHKFLREYISTEVPIKFIKYKLPMYKVGDDRKSEILASLKKVFSRIKIYDQYLFIKDDGGSAGIFRYEVLVQINPGEMPVWLDVKEVTDSSYDKVNNTKTTVGERLKIIKDSIYDKNISSNLFLTQIAGKDFNIRNMGQFALGVKISDVSHLEITDLILDEAYALGQMHARSLLNQNIKLEEYSITWGKINAEEIKKSAHRIKSELEKIYQSKI